MKYYELELEGETIQLRLTTNDVINIEKKTGIPFMQYVQGMESIQVVTDLLMYMRRSQIPNFSQKDAGLLIDKLYDNGYTLGTIITDVIMEGLSVSGFMSKEDMEKMKNNNKD